MVLVKIASKKYGIILLGYWLDNNLSLSSDIMTWNQQFTLQALQCHFIIVSRTPKRVQSSCIDRSTYKLSRSFEFSKAFENQRVVMCIWLIDEWLVCYLLACPDLQKRMPLKCFITKVFTYIFSWPLVYFFLNVKYHISQPCIRSDKIIVLLLLLLLFLR